LPRPGLNLGLNPRARPGGPVRVQPRASWCSCSCSCLVFVFVFATVRCLCSPSSKCLLANLAGCKAGRYANGRAPGGVEPPAPLPLIPPHRHVGQAAEAQRRIAPTATSAVSAIRLGFARQRIQLSQPGALRQDGEESPKELAAAAPGCTEHDRAMPHPVPSRGWSHCNL
jgi:hypothetical protein